MTNRPSKDMQRSHELFNEFCFGKEEVYNLGGLKDFILDGGGEWPNKQTMARWFKDLHYKADRVSPFVWRHNAGRHE